MLTISSLSTSSAKVSWQPATENSIRSLQNIAKSDTSIVSAITFEKQIGNNSSQYTAHIYENDKYVGHIVSKRTYETPIPLNFEKKFHFLIRNDDILVQFREGLSQKKLSKFLNKRNWRIVETLPENNAIIIKTNPSVINFEKSNDIKSGYELEGIVDSYVGALEEKALEIQSFEEVEFATPELEISEAARDNIYFNKPIDAGSLLPLLNAWQSTELKTRKLMYGDDVWVNAISFNQENTMPTYKLGFANDINWGTEGSPTNFTLSASAIKAEKIRLQQELANLEVQERALERAQIP